MRHRTWMIPAVLGLLAACSTYSPPVVVHDSSPFPGLASVIGQNGGQPVDVVLMHGMCTHTAQWASGAIDTITTMMDSNYKPLHSPELPALPNQIQIIEHEAQVAGGTVRFHALVWSPLTAELKQQLAYDNTGTPGGCTGPGDCKPRRAHFNGLLKDSLLNDCLSDAMVYEGDSRAQLQRAMVQALTGVLERSEAQGTAGPLVVVAESLGSKMLFDALGAMLDPQADPREHQLGQRAAGRLALVFMAANQLPILALAEQQVRAPAARPMDSLQRFLALRRAQMAPRGQALSKLSVVAFTDPNDLLSYRLLPSRYAGPDVSVADVLVSNAVSWFGLLEDPFAAHLDYLQNKDVGALVACGWPKTPACH